MEDNLTVDELLGIMENLREQDKEDLRRNALATHGQDPFEEEGQTQETIEDVARRVEAKLRGVQHDSELSAMNADIAVDGMIDPFGYEVEGL